MSDWTAESWRKAKELFGKTVELAPAERGRFLDEACGEDDWLRDAVAELVEQHELGDGGSIDWEKSPFEGVLPPLPEPSVEGSEAPTFAGLDSQRPPLSPQDELLGALIDGKYRVDGILGKGGMGVVYRAQHLGLDRSFALKLVRRSQKSSKTFLERFRTEARALGKLKHPNIVEVTDYGTDPEHDDMPYLVMEYLEGDSLNEVTSGEELPMEHCLEILDGIAAAIDHAHREDVLHADLKPENVFISSRADGDPEVKILDFGLAKLLSKEVGSGQADADSSPASRRAIAGTPAFMAPELVEGKEPSRETDIFAFGALAYQLLVGRPAHEGDVTTLLDPTKRSPPPPPSRERPSIPGELDEPLLAPLADDPRRRPRSAAAMVAAIRKALRTAARREWRAREIPRRMLVTVVLVLVALASSFLLSKTDLLRRLELRLVDVRFAIHPPTPVDSRILLLTIDDATLDEDPTALVDRADELGRSLARVIEAGADGVALDFLLPESWSRSRRFSELVMKHSERLTLAAFASPSGKTIGTECVRGLTSVALGEERALALFGFVNIDVGPDAIVRRGRSSYRGEDGQLWPTFTARATRRSTDSTPLPESFWIDHTARWQDFDRLSWRELEQTLETTPERFEGKLVLVGGDYAASGDDFHRIPSRGGAPRTVSGVVVQALLANTLLRHLPIGEASDWKAWSLSVVVVTGVVTAVLLLSRLGWALVICSIGWILYSATALAAFRYGLTVWPLAMPLVALGLATGGALVLRAKLPPFPATSE